jgi:hypothetical protein
MAGKQTNGSVLLCFGVHFLAAARSRNSPYKICDYVGGSKEGIVAGVIKKKEILPRGRVERSGKPCLYQSP